MDESILGASMTLHDVLPDEPEPLGGGSPVEHTNERQPDGESGDHAFRYLTETDTGDAPW